MLIFVNQPSSKVSVSGGGFNYGWIHFFPFLSSSSSSLLLLSLLPVKWSGERKDGLVFNIFSSTQFLVCSLNICLLTTTQSTFHLTMYWVHTHYWPDPKAFKPGNKCLGLVGWDKKKMQYWYIFGCQYRMIQDEKKNIYISKSESTYL